MDIEGQIPPTLPLQKGGISPLGKRGVGEIFTTLCLFNYGLLSNFERLRLSEPKQIDRDAPPGRVLYPVDEDQ